MLNVAEGVYQVRVPVPFPLKFVNCFLARGDDGWDLLDTGMHYGPAYTAWQEAFAALGITFREIRAIYVTHLHADHYGMARWFQERTGATVYMLDAEWAQAPLWENPERLPAALSNLFVHHGMPEEVLGDVIGTMLEIQRQMGTAPDRVITLHDGQTVWFGRYPCQVVHTPGHSDGMYGLYCERDGLFFIADHVLPKITPNVSLWPESSPDPLADYLRSLRKVLELPARQILPGHGVAIPSLPDRVRELLVHHDQRLEEMSQAVGEGRTGYEVARAVFRNNLTAHELRFAMAETLAHLEHLAQAGGLTRHQEGGQVIYLPR